MLFSLSLVGGTVAISGCVFGIWHNERVARSERESDLPPHWAETTLRWATRGIGWTSLVIIACLTAYATIELGDWSRAIPWDWYLTIMEVVAVSGQILVPLTVVLLVFSGVIQSTTRIASLGAMLGAQVLTTVCVFVPLVLLQV